MTTSWDCFKPVSYTHLDVYKRQDIYCESASRIYHVPVEKHGQNAELRQRGKVAELALGYGGSIGAMKSMDTTGSVPEEEMAGIVQQWRRESPAIVRMWKDCQNAAVSVITGRQPVSYTHLMEYRRRACARMTSMRSSPIRIWTKMSAGCWRSARRSARPASRSTRP